LKISKSRQINTQALCIISSWLSSVGVPHTVTQPGSPELAAGFDLLVDRKDSRGRKSQRRTRVVVQVDLLAPVPKDIDILVLVEDVMSLDRNKALEAYYSITEATGWGRPNPLVDRGPEPQGKTHDIHLLIIRHRELRSAPNLSEQVFKEHYDREITFMVRALMTRSPGVRFVLQRAGETPETLFNICRLVACNFHHKYRDIRGSDDQNKTWFRAHLKQRILNAVTQWKRQERNVLPDEQTVAVALNDGWFEPEQTLPESQDEGDRREGRVVPSLMDYLSGFGHVQRITLLTQYATKDDRFIDPEAKRLANKLLAEERDERCDSGCCAPAEAVV